MSRLIKTTLISALAGTSFALMGCSNASSADQTSAATEAASAVADAPLSDNVSANWDIQAEGSHIRFTAKQEGAPFTGEFQSFTGVINFDPQSPETGVVEITIPLSSVDAGTNDRNSTLPGKVWFSTKKFPDAIFKSTDISAGDGENAYVARGELSLKGASVPVILPFGLEIDGDSAVMTSQIEIDRTLWNVGAAPWDTDEWVSRDVGLDIQVTATRNK